MRSKATTKAQGLLLIKRKQSNGCWGGWGADQALQPYTTNWGRALGTHGFGAICSGLRWSSRVEFCCRASPPYGTPLTATTQSWEIPPGIPTEDPGSTHQQRSRWPWDVCLPPMLSSSSSSSSAPPSSGPAAKTLTSSNSQRGQAQLPQPWMSSYSFSVAPPLNDKVGKNGEMQNETEF